MNWYQALTMILPEIIMLAMACVLLMLQAFLPERRKGLIHVLALVTLALVAILTMRPYLVGSPVWPESILHGAFVRDRAGDLMKVFVEIVAFLALVYGKQYFRVWQQKAEDFYILLILSVFGMMVMISAANLLTLYLGLETLALASYAAVAMFRKIGLSVEAAVKYFVMGAVASGMLLYGMSLLYGATGSLQLSEIRTAVAALPAHDPLLLLALVFLLVGLAFKLGAVPFHMWLPDVYEGAPAAVMSFVASAPKIAGFAILYRVLVDGLAPISSQWQGIVGLLALLSMGLGNVVAIAQTNVKRMLAYSTISHVGFLLLGMLSGSVGYTASLFYALTYALMSVGAFGLLMLLTARGQEAETLDDLKGLNQRAPWLALMMAFLMASMAGVPPFVGFFSKLYVLQAAVEAGQIWLAIAAVLFAVMGAYYYLRVIKVMYFDTSENEQPVLLPLDAQAAITLSGTAQLFLGVFAGPLMSLCVWAMN